MKKQFGRKIYNLKLLVTDILFLLKALPKFKALKKDIAMTEVFREKIMTVVSAVNGCIYCKWFHAKMAVKSGIPAADVKKLLVAQFDTVATDFEINALLFAQHYAETNRNPDSEMHKRLIDFYGEKTADNILTVIRMIFFGNLYGNTLDSFVSRLKGVKAENSSFLFESLFFIFNFPIYLVLKASAK